MTAFCLKLCIFAAETTIILIYETPSIYFLLLFRPCLSVSFLQEGDCFCISCASFCRFHDVEQSRQCFAGVGTDTGFPRVAGRRTRLVCVAADTSPIQELCAAGERFADTDSGRLLRRRQKAGTAGASILLLGMCLSGK